jgi:hypothetical protein
VLEAAAWSRANSHLSGEQAVRAAEPFPWHPSLKALLAFPDLLARMAESPQWTEDLGDAYLAQQRDVMATIQSLRYRAQASGMLQQPEYRHLVQPAQAEVVYVPYYNPLVVYGTWWWHSHWPVVWHPWHLRPPVHISTFHIISKPIHRHHIGKPVHRHEVPAHVAPRPGFVPKPGFQVHDTKPLLQAKPVQQGARPHPRFERRESARLSSFRGKPDADRDAGRRHTAVRPQPTFGVSAPRTQAPPQPTFGVRPPRTHSSSNSAPVVIHNHVQQARIAGASPNSARLSSFRGKNHADRDAGRRHPGGAGGNASHSRRSR